MNSARRRTPPTDRARGSVSSAAFEPLTDEEALAAVRAEAFTDALADTLRARGHRVLLGHAHDDDGHTWTAVMADADGAYAVRSYGSLRAEQMWVRAGPEQGGASSERCAMVDDALDFLSKARRAPLSGYLDMNWMNTPRRPTYSATISPYGYRDIRAAALTGWWEDRIGEGHTPGPDGSAHLMLSLVLPAPLLACLAFDMGGTPTFTR